MTITAPQRSIYNQHLASYKSQQGKPYTYKKDFSDIEDKKPEVCVTLAKLDLFFRNHPAVNRKQFFAAPYGIYDDVDYYNIGYYTSQAAIKSYTLHLKQLRGQSPDSAAQVELIRDSLVYIKDFCTKYSIGIKDYFKASQGVVPAWVVHYAEHNVSAYALLGFTYFNFQIKSLIFSIPPDEIEFFLSDLLENYSTYMEKLDNSTTAKTLVLKGIPAINGSINKSNEEKRQEQLKLIEPKKKKTKKQVENNKST